MEGLQTPSEGPVLHVLVVGFHHKKGCQVEYSFPPLIPDGPDNHECPPGWKYLPTLALPDGSHNYDKDTVFFHLPSLTDPDGTVFGISCFRQIPVEKLKNRTADITRGTVQKAVCVLSTVPLYGHIQVKMELITHAYFDEGDFTKVSLLEDTYHHLNSCLQQIEDLHSAPQLFVGLSARDFVLTMRHKALLLFKLLLLEKKVIFFQSPVLPLCSTILSLLSLHPGMIENGLQHSACIRPSRPLSPVPQYPHIESRISSSSGSESHPENGWDASSPSLKSDSDEGCMRIPCDEKLPDVVPPPGEVTLNAPCEDPNSALAPPETAQGASLSPSFEGVNGNGPSLPRDPSMELLGEASIQEVMSTIAQTDTAKCALPLKLFADGYLCLPYLSLPYMDVLTDVNIRGYIIGATNVLFKQKKHLADVIVEIEGGRIETSDLELKRALNLSTEDLRFGDYLMRNVSEMKHDVYLDGVGWEGGDDWVRAQFHAYLLCLLRTSLLPEGSRELDQFNKWFVSAFQKSECFKKWLSDPLSKNILEINPGHPFTGQLSVADMKLRLAHTMQTTEGGRKLNQAMVSTSRVVSTTGRAVGGALSQAKGALSSWWSNLTLPPVQTSPSIEGLSKKDDVEEAMEAVDEDPFPVQPPPPSLPTTNSITLNQ